jgi:outer membrane lipoprotein-sorting protein
MSLFCAALAALAIASGSAAAQTVDEIVAKAYAAKGGDKWKSVQSTRMSARINLQGMELPMTIVSRRPNLMRQDITVPMQNVTIVQAFDGQRAWAINPMAGDQASELPAAATESMRDQADFDGPLADYKAKGNTIEIVGIEDVSGVKAHHLKITKKNGKVQHLYIDVARGVEVKSVSEIDMGAGMMRVETELSDYRTVDGFLVPFAIRVTGGPTGSVSMTVDKVEFNVPVDDSTFRMPAK